MNDSLRWSTTLLNSLYKHGVRQAIISPGSRSTPLTLAASIHPGIQKKVVLDERSAAFIALGIGKATGFPAVLICTSGTAAANYYPAVIEAKESGVPMIILSADRPPNLRNLGSSQTIDQLKIFGNQAVFFHEAGEPKSYESDIKRIAYAGKQAVERAISDSGAAHINLPFRKPLEPDAEFLQQEKERLEKEISDEEPNWIQSSSKITLHTKIEELLSSSKRPLIIAGPANPHQSLQNQIEELSVFLNAPVLAEPGSSAQPSSHSISGFDHFLRNQKIRKTIEPDLIIRFEDQPYSGSLLHTLEEWDDIPVIHVSSRTATQDHAMSVEDQIVCGKNDSIHLENIQSTTEQDWLGKWTEYGKISESDLAETFNKMEELTDGRVINYFSNQLSDEWNIMLSNSLPARDMLTFGAPLPHQFLNRGAAGIDGILSTALGIHLSSEKSTCCFIGDLAFLHDSNALYTLQKMTGQPFVAVVINNQGGNIFRMLPVYRSEGNAAPKDIYNSYFETPQNIDISHLAKASHISYQRIETPSELMEMNLNNVENPLIIECKTDPEASMNLRLGIGK